MRMNRGPRQRLAYTFGFILASWFIGARRTMMRVGVVLTAGRHCACMHRPPSTSTDCYVILTSCFFDTAAFSYAAPLRSRTLRRSTNRIVTTTMMMMIIIIIIVIINRIIFIIITVFILLVRSLLGAMPCYEAHCTCIRYYSMGYVDINRAFISLV